MPRILSFLSLLLFSALIGAFEGDAWDEMMAAAQRELQAGQPMAAYRLAGKAAEQGEYEGTDRWISSLVLLSAAAFEAGRWREAEVALIKAIDVIDRVPGSVRLEKAILHNNLGALLDQGGDLPAAERHYRSALAIQERLASVPDADRFSLLTNLGGLLGRRGKDEAAAQLYQEAGRYSERVTTRERVIFHNNAGSLQLRLGAAEAAKRELQAASAEAASAGLPDLLLAAIQHNLGVLAVEQRQYSQAQGLLEAALAIRKQRLGPDHPDYAKTLAALALVEQGLGAPAKALVAARAASRALGDALLSHGMGGGAGASQTRREWREALATHLRLLAGAGLPAAEAAGEAFEIMQMARLGETARVFASAQLADGGVLAGRLQEIGRLRERFEQAERALIQVLERDGGRGTADELAQRNELLRLREALVKADAELAVSHPKYHELVSGKRARLRELQSILKPDEAMLYYLTAREESFVLAVTASEATFVMVPLSQQQLNAGVQAVRRSVDPGLGSEDRFAGAESHALFKALVAPVLPQVSGRAHWFLVPDGALESLPFALLLGSPPPPKPDWKAMDWLIRRHALVTLPNPAALMLARAGAVPVQAPQAYLGIADPVLGEGSAATRRVRSVSALRGGELWAEVRGRRLANPAQLKKLSPLPDTADEARLLAQALGGGDILLGPAANEGRVKATDLSRYRHLLFATHGVMASDLVEFGEPALVMTPPDSPSETDDGLLAASEIARLKLNADWVLLSACNTAATDGEPGAEGFSGLAKAFFHAGARNLLVSHWSVVSESTVLLSTGVFSRLAGTPGLSKARALQQSTVAMIEGDPAFRHPMFWAPFVLVGEGR